MPTVAVRTPVELDAVDALILPGGESTTIAKLMATAGLDTAIQQRIEQDSLPVMGTCAGMILCARTILDGAAGQTGLDVFDAAVRRNGLGNQAASREVSVAVDGLSSDFTAIFIRPPMVDEVGDGVEVLAWWQDRPILCRQGRHLFSSFHPEMTADGRIHQLFLERL